MYLTAADNSLRTKTHYNVLISPLSVGALIAMVPTLVFYQLGLVSLVCVFLMLCSLRPNDAVAPRQPIMPAKPPRPKRSKEPKPFADLTQKPQCALCEHEAAHPHEPPPSALSQQV